MSHVARLHLIAGAVMCLAFAPEYAARGEAGEGVPPASSSPNVSITGRECVILVHGLMRRKSSLNTLERTLGVHGFDVANWDYLSTRQTISESADALYECYELNARYHSKVHFVSHSLGGIVVRCMLKEHAVPKLGKIVMLGPPNQGSAVARTMLKGPLKWVAGPPGQELQSKEYLERLCAAPKTGVLIIAGTKSFDYVNPVSYVSGVALEEPNDGTVSVKETRLEGLPEPLQVKDSHTGLPNNPEVIKAVLDFLQDASTREKEQSALEEGLRILRQDPGRVKDIISSLPSLPNVRTKTLGGKMFWADLVNVDGWRVQENVLLGNCRLLDPGNVRQAWGKKEDMVRAFEAVVAETRRSAAKPDR